MTNRGISTFALGALGLILFVRGVSAQTAAVPAATGAAHQVVLSHVPSDRKWKLGFNSRTYDKASTELEELIAKKLTDKDMAKADAMSGTCCKLVIEVVEISQHTAAFGKSGIDMVANFVVQDAAGKQLISRIFRGESRTVGMHTWGGMIDMAEKLLVDSAFEAEELTAALKGSGSR